MRKKERETKRGRGCREKVLLWLHFKSPVYVTKGKKVGGDAEEGKTQENGNGRAEGRWNRHHQQKLWSCRLGNGGNTYSSAAGESEKTIGIMGETTP